MYLEAMGQPILMLGSLERATDILERRAATYSDRPVLPALELMDVGWSFSLMQYGTDWRAHRRSFHKLLSSAALPRYKPIFDDEIPGFLKKLQDTPEAFLDHTRDLFGYAIMRVTYGFDDPQVNKSLLRDGEALLQAFAEATLPGRYLVNDIPFLKHVPAWFPGAGFRRYFKEMAATSERVLKDAFERAWKDIRGGHRNGQPSMVDDLIENLPDAPGPEREEALRIAKNVCAVTYSAGADTMVGSLTALFLALASNPEAQRKAQLELDSVVGSDRLPSLEDREGLPYVSAIVKEVERWHTVAPLGFAHVTARDDEYNGYFIPKGTYVMTNTWAILHDPAVYKDPLEFNPDRFIKDGQLDPSVRDPASAIFGYGRRICPGRFLGENTFFLVTASVLSAFNVYPPKDESGNPITLKLNASPCIISTPAPYKVDIRLRSPQHAKPFSQ
ncbi:cytochrome P450 [Coprinellus micaceus]|uniref:Cytochrome P450 n=1 Tax=Coprinellus micaceus TaxID=71717 RepID=A0A4Y7SLQ8_COPMI|nr:cytochrome P450 [Coprinellus micaceus]